MGRSDASPNASLFVRAVFFVILLPGTVLGLVPWLLVAGGRGRFDAGVFRFAGIPLVALGGMGLVWCVWDFAGRGRGTLAPVDPPRTVVRTGLYGVVRNPMYVSNLLTLVGEGLLLGSAAILVWAAVNWVANLLFVVAYEEPTLARSFGADYEAYRRSVPRWVPKMGRSRDGA